MLLLQAIRVVNKVLYVVVLDLHATMGVQVVLLLQAKVVVCGASVEPSGASVALCGSGAEDLRTEMLLEEVGFKLE